MRLRALAQLLVLGALQALLLGALWCEPWVLLCFPLAGLFGLVRHASWTWQDTLGVAVGWVCLPALLMWALVRTARGERCRR